MLYDVFGCATGNDLDAESCDVLAATLLRLDELKELHLDDNDIESEGTVALTNGLRSDTGAGKSLSVLSVCTCCITAYGAVKLARYDDFFLRLIYMYVSL